MLAISKTSISKTIFQPCCLQICNNNDGDGDGDGDDECVLLVCFVTFINVALCILFVSIIVHLWFNATEDKVKGRILLEI